MIRILLVMLVALVARTGSCQQLETQELLDVVKKWNFANNAGSEQTFRELYDDKVFFYAEALTRNQCIAAKKDQLKFNPSFKQKIVTDPTFVAQTGGVIKSQFTKEVYERGRWRKVPTYLLISYENNRYVISGESDFETDKRQKRQPDIGAPMEIPAAKAKESIAEKSEFEETEVMDTSVIDSAIVSTASQDTLAKDTLTTDAEDSTLLTSVSDEVLSDETVSVPKKYVYFLIGFLVLTALIVLFSKNKKKTRHKTMAPQREPVQARNEKNFDSFVIALFDPHYFTVDIARRKRVMAGNVSGQDFTPGLELDFQNKDSKVRLAIQCIYIGNLSSQEVLSFSSAQINRFHDFEETFGMETYLVIGLEGDPGDPKEVYLIPTDDLREGHIRYPDLQPYRKHGMFFYNSVRRRLL